VREYLSLYEGREITICHIKEKIMELYENETENRDYLFNKLKDNTVIASYNCSVGKEIPVPYKNIYIPVRKTLEIWCFDQDICVYQKLFDKTIDTKNIVVASDKETILKVELQVKTKKEDIGMPFVAIETKMKNADTHELLAASEKIKMIKTIFPYCKGFLLVFGLPPPRFYRLCSGFDEILFLEKLDDNDCDFIINKIAEETGKVFYYVTSVASF
jgi:hypothetical protein